MIKGNIVCDMISVTGLEMFRKLKELTVDFR